MQLRLLILLILVMCGMSSELSGQQFDKDWTLDMMQRTLKKKIRKDIRSLAKSADLKQQLERPAAQAPAPTLPAFRDEPERGISSSPETESEIHAAVNPVDTNNMIVAAMKFSEGVLGPALSFPIYYTSDFGASWKLSQFDGVNDINEGIIAGGGDPILVFDSEGTAYLSWLTLTLELPFDVKIALNWAISRDGGATWQRQPDIIDGGSIGDLLEPTGRFVDKQWMAVDRSNSAYRDNIYIAYAEIDFSDTSYQILVKRKETLADTIDSEIARVTPDDFAFAQFTSIDVDNQGHIHLMFAGARLEDSSISLYHSRSVDGGQTFSAPSPISELHLPCFPPEAPNPSPCSVVGIDSARMYPCPHLRVDRSGGPDDSKLYAVWTSDGPGQPVTTGLDIYFSESADGGANWSAARVLNNDPNPATHQFFPSLAVNEEGTVVMTWYDRREDSANVNTKYYMTYSKDGGQLFEPDFPVSAMASDFARIGESNANFGIGEYTQVITTANYAIPFWADGRTNDGNIEIYTTKIPLREGLPTSTPTLSTVTDQFTVRGPFPNPAADLTRLELELKNSAQVTTTLFDTKGSLLRTSDQGRLAQGEHQINLPLEGLATGTYILMLTTDFGQHSMILQKGN